MVPRVAALCAGGLSSADVLVDGDDLFIGENGKRLVGDFGEVSTDNKRGFSYRPKSKMSLLFFMRKASIANFKHVWIVPTSRTSNSLEA